MFSFANAGMLTNYCGPITVPPPIRDTPPHPGLLSLVFTNSMWVSSTSHRIYMCKGCETGPMVYRKQMVAPDWSQNMLCIILTNKSVNSIFRVLFVSLYIRDVTKISSCRVNARSRWGIKQLGVSFGSIFLLFSFESSRGQSHLLMTPLLWPFWYLKVPSKRAVLSNLSNFKQWEMPPNWVKGGKRVC